MRTLILLLIFTSLSAENFRIEALAWDADHHLHMTLSDHSVWQIRHLPPRHCAFQIKQIVQQREGGRFLNLSRRFQFDSVRMGTVSENPLKSYMGIPSTVQTTCGEQHRHFILLENGSVYIAAEHRLDPWNGRETLLLIESMSKGAFLLNYDRREIVEVEPFCTLDQACVVDTICDVRGLTLATEGGRELQLSVGFSPALSVFSEGEVVTLFPVDHFKSHLNLFEISPSNKLNFYLLINQSSTALALVAELK